MRRTLWPVAGLVLALLVAACGGSASPAPGATSPLAGITPGPSPATPAPATPTLTPPAPATTPTDGPGVATVPVVACPTEYGLDETPNPLPATVEVDIDPAMAGRLAAFANNADATLGPRGWTCEAQVGVDGSSVMRVFDPADAAAAVTLASDPACYGCALDLACPLFPAAAEQLAADFGTGCSITPDPAEETAHVADTVAAFVDPPGVAGTGAGSGGPYEARGYLYFAGVEAPAAAKATCTVGPADADLCEPILDTWLVQWNP